MASPQIDAMVERDVCKKDAPIGFSRRLERTTATMKAHARALSQSIGGMSPPRLDLRNMHIFRGGSVQRVLPSFLPGLDGLQTSKLYPCRNEIDVCIVSSWERNAPRSLAKHRHLTPCAPLSSPRPSHPSEYMCRFGSKRGAYTTLDESDGSPPLPVEETFCFFSLSSSVDGLQAWFFGTTWEIRRN